MPTQSVTDKIVLRDWVLVNVRGVFVWRLTIDGVTTTLPEPSEFNHDDVKQGGYHEMLSGKQRRDILGTRQHFFLKWHKLEQSEADALRTLFATAVAGNDVRFTCIVGTYRVVIANIETFIYDNVGYIDTGVTFEETE